MRILYAKPTKVNNHTAKASVTYTQKVRFVGNPAFDPHNSEKLVLQIMEWGSKKISDLPKSSF